MATCFHVQEWSHSGLSVITIYLLGFFRRGFVEFVNEEEALSAVETGREMTWEEKKIFVFRVWDTPGRDKEGKINK